MSQPNSNSENSNFFGEIVHSYTRAQAIEDGVLIDVTETAKEAGFRWPVAVTAAVWSDCIAWNDDDNTDQGYQDQSGRLWDVLFMASYAVRTANRPDRQLQFSLQRVPRGGRSTVAQRVTLRLLAGPGDDGEPVITILQPNED
ncbi:MAG: DUF6573 family protein [Woeseia sp.]